MIRKSFFIYAPLNVAAILLTWIFGAIVYVPIIFFFYVAGLLEHSKTGAIRNANEQSKEMGALIEMALYRVRSLNGLLEIDIERPTTRNE